MKHVIFRRASMIALSVVMLSAPSWVNPSTAQAQGHERRLKSHLISPAQLLKHAEALELTQAQRVELKELLKASSSKMIDLRFELQAEVESLEKMLEVDKVDEKKAAAQAEKLLKVEGALKRETLVMMIKAKNVLTPAQLAKVKAHQENNRQRPPKGKNKQRPKRGAGKDPVF